MAWFDIFRLWKLSTTDDYISRRDKMRNIEGAGVTSPDVMPDIRGDGSFWSGGRGSVIRLRDSTDFIDLSSVTNRQSRYKEYERLRGVAEIETAMTVFADESCVSGETKVATPLGFIKIKTLAENKKPGELFLVYTYDEDKEDITLSWAHSPRKTKTAKTLKFALNDGSCLVCTPDHKILMRDGTWKEAKDIKTKDKLMPFHRKRCGLGKVTSKYSAPFPHERVLSVKHGWKAEKQLIEEFRTNKKSEDTECMDVITRCIHNGMMSDQVAEFIKKKPPTMKEHISIRGTTYRELRELYLRYGDSKFVMSIEESEEIDVYDLTVNGTHNFATDSAIVHNCQIGKNNHIFEIICKNSDIKDELNYLFFFPGMLNMDRELFNLSKNLYIFGDYFVELVIDPEDPKSGILKMQPLPPDSIYRIETIKGKLLEFQQSKSGPDYEALAKVEVTQATDLDLMQSNAIRFAPQQIVHFRIGDHRKTFYPYGVSLIEPARGPAHTMKLLEDSMIVYRLCLVGNTRVRTNNGYKYIKDLMINDKVYSYVNGNQEETNVTSAVSNGIKDVYKVKSRHVEITGTATHPILVNRDGVEQYVEIQNLKPKKDKLIIVPDTDSCVEHKISRESNNNKIIIPEYVNQDFAKLFGFLCQNSDYSELSECDKVNKYYGQLNFNYNRCGILENISRIPEWVYKSPKNIRRAFIEGLCDANGSGKYSKQGIWSFTIKLLNEKMIEDIKELWTSIGLCSGEIKTKKGYYSLTITDRNLPNEENVLSVTYVGKKEVFDISVDHPEHNFIANGIPVHNSRAPERRVFYIDVGQLPPFKAEMVVERLKDQLRKRKTTSTRGGPGAGSVEERWTAPSQDEDFWIPTRPNSNTRVETLPGAQGLGEIDDALFFRNKLFIALNFPKIYMAQEDLQVARVPLSQTDLKFARNVERLQHSVEDGLMEIARRHLELRGYPTSLFEDLLIKMTPPSQYRALADNEIKEILYQRAMALMGSGLYSRYDILTKILEYSEEEAKEMVGRAIAQQVQDLKLQQMAANPDWMGIVSSQPKGPEMGTDMNGPSPELTGNEPPIPPAEGQAPAQPLTATLSPEQMQGNKAEDTYGKPQTPESKPLPEPTDEEIKQFDLDIIDYSQDIDEEEIDAADLDE